MVETKIEQSDDRLVLRLEPNGPIELEELTGSFAALARIYERHHRSDDHTAKGPAPKLYVSRLETGSIIAEVVPLITILGQPIPYMDSFLIVKEFTRWVGGSLKSFAGQGDGPPPQKIEDVKDLEAFVRPLTRRRGAGLNIKHARFRKKDGDKEILAEYDFDESSLNRAALNMSHTIQDFSGTSPQEERKPGLFREVLMYFHQANREAGKEKGRTGDRGIIEEISVKPLMVYFPKQANDIKRRILEGSDNIFSKGYIVDVHVSYVNGEPKLYHVLDLHGVVDLDTGD